MREFRPYPKTITAKKPKKFLNRSRKPTGELPVFKEIMRDKLTKEGKTVSEVSGEEIQNPTHWNFHHVLAKGKYPAFRRYKKNIIIITDDEHTDWHERKEELRTRPEWQWVFELEEELKQEYEQLKKDAA